MAVRKDTTGLRSGRLLCLNNLSGKVTCQCDCGNIKNINRNHFLGGKIQSCGCLQKERVRESNPPTLASNNPRLYSIWGNMQSRCTNPNVDCYPRYGGRGITVSEDWLTFEGFLSNIPDGYSDELELDRIDNNGNYCKENCRWVDRSIQCFNRTTKCGGVTYCERDNLYRAKIVKDGKSYQKYFKLESDAISWRKSKELELYGFNV